MAETLILYLGAPGAKALSTNWWRVADGLVSDSGAGDDWRDVLGNEARVIALVPADEAPVRWIELPDLTAAQAQAAARLATADTVLGDPQSLHIAAGAPLADGRVPTAAVSRAAMADWTEQLAAMELRADAIVPIAALPPPPPADQALRVEWGQDALLVTSAMSAPADPALDALRVGTAEIKQAPADAPMLWLADLSNHVPLDLMQGDYAQRRSAAFTPSQQRWLIRLTVAALLLAVALPLAQMWVWSRTVAAADARTLAVAKSAGIAASDAATAEAEIDRRLAARGGGPLALSAPLGGLYRALQAQPAVALRSLSHVANGTLTVTLASPRTQEVNAVLTDLQARGFVVTAQAMAGSDGMQMANITIRAVP